jgi:peroxiredoxin
LKDKLTVLFGVPNRGKVCSETHLPGYLAELDSLRKQGVDQILCISVGDGQTVAEWGSKVCPSNDIMVAADVNGGLTRLLGMDLDPASPTDPASLRYAIALEDGIILKVVRVCQYE